MFNKILAALALVIASAPTGAVAMQLDCSTTVAMNSQTLYTNSGFYGSSAPAVTVVPRCVDQESGWYGNFFLNATVFDLNDRRAIPEFDVRVGRLFKVDGPYWLKSLDWDASVADYVFHVPGAGMFNSLDWRVRVSRTFLLSESVSVQPYAIMDLQNNLIPVGANALAFAGGTLVSWKDGGFTASLDTQAWKYTASWTAGRGPIYSVGPGVAYDLTENITVGSQFTFVSGSWTSRDSGRKESSLSLFAVQRF